MNRWKIGWKVTDNFRFSFFGSDGWVGGGVRYKINHVVKPSLGCGPLCVFRTREAAEKFSADFTRSGRVFKCLYFESYFSSIWTTLNIPVAIEGLPPETALASKVCLLKEERNKL